MSGGKTDRARIALCMLKRLLVVGNWKMNPESASAAGKLLTDTIALMRGIRGVQTIVCPPFVWLTECRRRYRGKSVLLGAQDVSQYPRGAHTGEVSAEMLASLSMQYVIVGHSERRAAGDTEAGVNEKVKQALSHGLSVILCIGESARDEHGDYLHVLRAEITSALTGVTGVEINRLILAYEPIWAIGKSAQEAMKPEVMHETGLYIRKIVAQLYGLDQARMVPILYGGSVEPSNAEALLTRGEVDGFLVGHASLSAETFGPILKAAHVASKHRLQL